jgi:hypothetical protein
MRKLGCKILLPLVLLLAVGAVVVNLNLDDDPSVFVQLIQTERVRRSDLAVAALLAASPRVQSSGSAGTIALHVSASITDLICVLRC